jgi:Fe-S-cluster formation regulator IscX/YfhJ
MGGSGGYGFSGAQGAAWQPSGLAESLERTRQQAAAAEVAAIFDEAVSEINQMNTEALDRRREKVLEALQELSPDVADLHGGGSYTRHTYVDGLSDVDLLFGMGPYSSSTILNKDDPAAVIGEMKKLLRKKYPTTKMTTGRMAVTMHFSDGLELQILPAFSYHSGYKIPDYDGKGWTVTRPQVFAERLRERNEEVDGKLLRCIKLAKRICHMHNVEVKSYHLENMAVRAFDRYAGPRSDEAMLRHLFNHAKTLVTTHMRDITGQNAYVDNYLTSKTMRVGLARQMATVERDIAAAEGNAEAWRDMLGLPEK